jgi:aryl-alcohol dehydrogenase-like predicted oxidoreductase
VYQAIDVLEQQGKVIYAGSSNYAGWHIAPRARRPKRMHVLGIVSEQSKYSLATRYIELEVLPPAALRRWRHSLEPAGGGCSGGVLSVRKARGARAKGPEEDRAARKQLEAWEGFCKELGEKPGDVALAWMLTVPGSPRPIIGPRTMEQLAELAGAGDQSWMHERMARSDEIWPPAERRMCSRRASRLIGWKRRKRMRGRICCAASQALYAIAAMSSTHQGDRVVAP